MSLQGWRKETIAILSDKIGPVAEIIVDDVLARMGIGEDGMIATNYLRFLEALYRELPKEVDRKALVLRLRDQAMKWHKVNGSGAAG